MTRRARILGFGSAGLLVIVGAVCAVLIGGGTGQVLALVLISLGFVEATSLVFLEVGLSEDHERAREDRERARREQSRPQHDQGGARLRRSPMDRMRGRSRRLR
jgi:hypothetical protein